MVASYLSTERKKLFHFSYTNLSFTSQQGRNIFSAIITKHLTNPKTVRSSVLVTFLPWGGSQESGIIGDSCTSSPNVRLLRSAPVNDLPLLKLHLSVNTSLTILSWILLYLISHQCQMKLFTQQVSWLPKKSINLNKKKVLVIKKTNSNLYETNLIIMFIPKLTKARGNWSLMLETALEVFIRYMSVL